MRSRLQMSTHESQLATLLDRAPAEAVREPEARQAITRAVARLVEALRHHHTGTADHSNRLAAHCRRVGEALDLPPDVLFELELVAILHDIGKLAVPAAILDLARPLNARERAVVRSHTMHGAEILAEIAGLAAPRAARAREPRALGRHGLSGRPARATRSRSPPGRLHGRRVRRDDQRPPVPARARAAEARSRIEAGAGTAFDPAVVRALLGAVP